jgi:two-component system, NtrC family, C4-dicarboxylate transport sensor histidine kinase DctB
VTEGTDLLTPIQISAHRFQMVSRLADDLAHEVKNPLHAMVINLELVRRRINGGDQASALDRLGVVEAEVHRVNRLVDALLHLLRPAKETGGSVDVDRAVLAVAPLIELQARLAHVGFRYEPCGGTAAAMRRDALEHALVSLLLAAVAMQRDAGGDVALTATGRDATLELTLRCEAPPSARAGNGFSMREQDRDGISVATALVEEAGGRLELQHSPAGAEFILVLPRAGVA